MRWPGLRDRADGRKAAESGVVPDPDLSLPRSMAGNGSLEGGERSTGSLDFNGRKDAQRPFLRLLDAVAESPGSAMSAFVQVSGAGGSGRRALLAQFHRLSTEGERARCGPVIELRGAAELELEELLEGIARGLEAEAGSFKPFFKALERLHGREAGRPTVAAQGVGWVRAGTSAAKQLGAGPPAAALDAVTQSPIGEAIVERAEANRTPAVVREEFVRGLLHMAKEKGPLVLLFSDVDLGFSNAAVIWLCRSLFPRIARAPVIVALSTEPDFDLADLSAQFAHAEHLRLGRFSADEAEAFLERKIGIGPKTPLGRHLLDDSDHFPDRLARYADYFRDHEEALSADEVPPEISARVSGGSVFDLLSRVREQWDRTGDNTVAVATGLQRTGRIITSAALLLVVVIGAFSTSGIVFIKMIGIGMIIAILVDATIVRALLVPATMRLLGRWNWWAPRPLARFWERHGFREESAEPALELPETREPVAGGVRV